MILEYNSFINSDVIIEVLNGPYWDFILNEEYRFEKVDEDQSEILKNIENIVESRLNEINPFIGKHFNDKNNQTRIIDYELKSTEHWYIKFLRKELEDSRYINPAPLEGVNLIYNNRNEITKMIDSSQILDNYRVMIRTKDASKYTIIVIFEKKNKSFSITMQTQMKGKEYNDINVDRIIKLHPDGPRV